MKFRDVPTGEAAGWYLAHSLKLGATKLPKGLKLTVSHIAQLVEAGIQQIHGYRYEDGDIAEDEAAERIARHILGAGLTLGVIARGRANLHASATGLLAVPDILGQLNHADEAITLATLPNMSPVHAGQLVATVKIIPYAVSETSLSKAMQVMGQIAVSAFTPFTADLIVSGANLPEKTLRLTEKRLATLGGEIIGHHSCDHTVTRVSEKLKEASATSSGLILILGISAISDRRDILPMALEAAGGEIISLGMPVDPGNLLMLGQLGNKTVIGLPGCARSPALNGLDWVLERFAANLPLNRDVIADMGIGGLLKETSNRPEPRAPIPSNTQRKIQPIILAAGRSTRSGTTNKLLMRMNGHTVIRQTVARVAEAGFDEPIIVTGYQAEDVNTALSGISYRHIHNPGYASGMASSLKLGLSLLDKGTEFACVCLGDMPLVNAATLKALASAATRFSEFKVFIPTFNGKRGNPVLWQADMFPLLGNIRGDKGGRQIIHDHEDLVCEVSVEDHGILIDLDTPEALAQFGATEGR